MTLVMAFRLIQLQCCLYSQLCTHNKVNFHWIYSKKRNLIMHKRSPDINMQKQDIKNIITSTYNRKI